MEIMKKVSYLASELADIDGVINADQLLLSSFDRAYQEHDVLLPSVQLTEECFRSWFQAWERVKHRDTSIYAISDGVIFHAYVNAS